MRSVTINASPIICLSMVGKLHLVPQLFKQVGNCTVFVTPRVVQELIDPITKKEFKKMIDSKQIIIYDKQLPYDMVFKTAAEVASNSKELNPQEHMGEAEIILLAEQIGSDFVIIDENAAKPVIKEKGISHLNHLRVVDLCVENNIIRKAEALKILRELIKKKVKYSRGVINAYESKWS